MARPISSPLRVRFGVSESKLVDLVPNDDENPGYVNSDHFTGYVCLRLVKPETTHVVEGGNRIPIPETDYFKGKSRLFSLQFSGRFKATNPKHPQGYWTADDVEYAVQFDGPVKSSYYVTMVTKVVMMIAPSLEIQNINRPERPFVAFNVFTSCNALSAHTFDESDVSARVPKKLRRVCSTDSPPLDPGPWKFGGAKELEETPDILIPILAAEGESNKKLIAKRRNHFALLENRKSLELRPNIVVGADLFNPNFNPASGMLEMKNRMKLDAGSVINYQPIRWVVRAKHDPSSVFFVLEVDYKADAR